MLLPVALIFCGILKMKCEIGKIEYALSKSETFYLTITIQRAIIKKVKNSLNSGNFLQKEENPGFLALRVVQYLLEIHKGLPLFFASSLKKSDCAICIQLDIEHALTFCKMEGIIT